MNRNEIVRYWSQIRQRTDGKWVHPDDDDTLANNAHTFNLDFPVSPYVGDVLNAGVIILGANAGYCGDKTPLEFSESRSIKDYLERIRNPSSADWSNISGYYEKTNYGNLLFSGQAVLVNACPYRSPRISLERDNQRLIDYLPSVKFMRSWLIETVLTTNGGHEALVIGKRHGLWDLSKAQTDYKNFVVDPAPVSPHISKTVWNQIDAVTCNRKKARCQERLTATSQIG